MQNLARKDREHAATSVCSHAYLVSRLGAALPPVKFSYDIYLRDVHRHRAKTYEIVPTLIEQIDLAGSRLSKEHADGAQSFLSRRVLSYHLWKLTHEICRRRYLLATFGSRYAPSMTTPTNAKSTVTVNSQR